MIVVLRFLAKRCLHIGNSQHAIVLHCETVRWHYHLVAECCNPKVLALVWMPSSDCFVIKREEGGATLFVIARSCAVGTPLHVRRWQLTVPISRASLKGLIVIAARVIFFGRASAAFECVGWEPLVRVASTDGKLHLRQ